MGGEQDERIDVELSHRLSLIKVEEELENTMFCTFSHEPER